MTTEWSVPAWAAALTVGVLVLLLLAAVLVALRSRVGDRRRVAAAESATVELRERLDALEARVATTTSGRTAAGRGVVRTEQEFVITSLGKERADASGSVPALPAPAFADAVLRDTVVHAAALVHGVRRALSPEVRNRIRFEMKRELKRTRKERKTEVREALREYRAKYRADVPDLDGVA